MTTVFGKGRRNRHNADDGETAQLADEANLWWTRRDFVQHAVVRTRRPKADPPPAAPGPPPDAPVAADPTLSGRPFSDVFTTESLFCGDASAGQRRDLRGSGPSPTAATPPPPTSPRADAPAPDRGGKTRIPVNHPLTAALVALGLDGNATWADVQNIYRARAKEAHPDHSHDDGAAMAELNAAYAALRDGRRYGLFDDD